MKAISDVCMRKWGTSVLLRCGSTGWSQFPVVHTG